jgi:DNA-binding response OmpR family regulator
MGTAKILIVEDEPNMVAGLRDNFEYEGFQVLTALDGVEGLERALKDSPDLVVLDVMMPRMSGLDVCKQLKAKRPSIPIIILTARGQEVDKVVGLELGADDYVTKPFALHEFLARVKARLRRQSSLPSGHDEAIALGEIVLDPSRQQLTVRGAEVSLAPKEFGLLRVLMENQGRVVTRQTLLDKVWGYDFEGEQQTVSVHIRWLREKIEEDSRSPRHILTVRSRGYMFKA